STYGPDVKIQYHRLTHEELVRLYHDSDVLLAPSRGEGNNKPAMEFMATGGPVIASDWGGHQNWLHRDSGWALGGRMVRADAHSNWFEVSRAELKHAILEAWHHPELVARKGIAARQFISGFDWSKMAERFARELEMARG